MYLDLELSVASQCKAFVYLNKDRRENGKHIARGIDAVNLGFASNTSAYILYIPERKTLITWIITTN